MGREQREEVCWPLNSRDNADFTAEIKLSHQRRCLRRNLPLLEAQGSMTEAKPSRWPRLETEPKTNPSQCRGVCSQQLHSGVQQCDPTPIYTMARTANKHTGTKLSLHNLGGDVSPDVTNAMPELELLLWISLLLKKQEYPGQVMSSWTHRAWAGSHALPLPFSWE